MSEGKWSYFGDAFSIFETLTLCWMYSITKKCLYYFYPLKPHFYIVKLGFTGYTLFFLFLLKNIDCRYSLEPPRRGGSNEYPHSMFWAEIWKYVIFLSENFYFLMVRFSVYLNRHVFESRVLIGTHSIHCHYKVRNTVNIPKYLM